MKSLLLTLAILAFTPVAFAQDGLTVEVTAIMANIRKAPSAKSPIVKTVPQNTELPVYGFEPKKGWYLVRLGDNWGGWIKASLVRNKTKMQKSDA